MNANGIPRQLRCMLPAFLLSLGLASSATAQTPVVFVHGILSDGGTWGSTPAYIAGQFYVVTYQPSLPSLSRFENQAASLKGQVGYQPPNMIAVGHSNGGIVSRVANYTGVPQPMQGIVTIGTPHSGAPLATNTLDGATLEFLSNWGAVIVQPLVTYAGYIFNDFCGFICYRLYDGVVRVFDAALGTLVDMGFLVLDNTAAGARATTVLGQMEPYAPFINQELNSGPNLAREAATLGVRYSIISEAPPYYTSMFTGLTGSPAHNTSWQHFAMAVYQGMYEYYYDYYDYGDPDMWAKRLNAWLWGAGFVELYETDYHWCNLIGGWDYYSWVCRSDGIVPVSSQRWPGSNRERTIPGGPGHMNETNNPTVQGYLSVALATPGFVIASPPPAPPPPYYEPPPPPDGGGGDCGPQACPVYLRAAPVPTDEQRCRDAKALSQSMHAVDRARAGDRRSVMTDARNQQRNAANKRAC
jgi:pimeloyl-ACP methyl ester carboxylesterase